MKFEHTAAVLFAIWFFAIVYLSITEFPNVTEDNMKTKRQLFKTLEVLHKLRDQHAELKDIEYEMNELKLCSGRKTNEHIALTGKRENPFQEVDILSSKDTATVNLPSVNFTEPSVEHERARRELERVSTEFWLFIRSELNKLKQNNTGKNAVKMVNEILGDSTEYQKRLKYDFYRLENEVDNAGEWRYKQSQKLGHLVQRRLHYLQNPEDCTKAKKMVCDLAKACGYGCQIHHVTYCLIMAYATQRTLILLSSQWQYSSQGWESVFEPLSKTCNSTLGQTSIGWESHIVQKDAQVVNLPFIENLKSRPNWLPLAIPDDLADRLMRFHGDPSVWWIGQFVTYITRPNTQLYDYMKTGRKKLGFENPIVGVHVRRTDKINREAKFHGVEEYMTYVAEWFDIYEQRNPNVQRRVYLASDDPGVLDEARKDYPDYIFVSDNGISKTAELESRHTEESLRGIILDTHLLSLCDYLVCTFSSQVCRVAYELMQVRHGDASRWFKSLDDSYYFGGQNSHQWKISQQHVARNGDEISLNVGDLVSIAGNHWNGYSKGKDMNTNKSGLFLSYKAVDKIDRVKMPTYPEVPDL